MAEAVPAIPTRIRLRRGAAAFALGAALAMGIASPIATQPFPASLIADSVRYDAATETLTATGDVEVLYRGRVLTAREIVYDSRAGEIRAAGPLTLTDPESGVVLAESATLTPDLAEGLIRGAQLLVADQLQIAAGDVQRSGGRYNTLERVVASSCRICEGNPTPTWAIRAARVTQDEDARRIFFQDARFEALGVPIAYLPRLSIPDPTVERADGFLIPSAQQSNIYGLGVKAPYYFVLGPSADATLTPFLTTTGAVLMEGQYRRRFTNGGFDLDGVIALSDRLNDGLGGDPGRGALATAGDFALGRGFEAQFDINLVTDDSFLAQYDYSDADRLTSVARLVRATPDSYLELGGIGFQSLRDDEDTATVPFILPDFSYRRLFEAPVIGGRLAVDADALGVLRESGGQMLRAGGGVDWRQNWVLPYGLLASAGAGARVEFYDAAGYDDAQNGQLARANPTLGAELSWPVARTERGGAIHVIEPIVQVLWTGDYGDVDNPNEDSQLPELDETNLFWVNRFPGFDRIESGLRANVGARYTRYDPEGWNLGVTIGRVLRSEPDPDFPTGSGLSGTRSDIVGALALDFASGFGLSNRALFRPDFTFQRNEFAMVYESERAGLLANYVYLAEDDSDPIIGPQPETNEIGVDARYRFRQNWEIRGLWRYDARRGEPLRAGGGLTYGNQCAEIDLGFVRRYTSSEDVPPSTSFGFSVRLAGIGDAPDREWPARACAPQGI